MDDIALLDKLQRLLSAGGAIVPVATDDPSKIIVYVMSAGGAVLATGDDARHALTNWREANPV